MNQNIFNIFKDIIKVINFLKYFKHQEAYGIKWFVHNLMNYKLVII